ncbi:MAG TPA: hypothetical protein VMD99_11300 [Terriglobales bacterium]|nr:hypothetical protein [Terriglobales bacterium]
MYLHQGPDDRVSIQLNSELQHAQLELLSAHCAIHQLRLHYSVDDLARFGRRDILRKSATAATALHEFYADIESRFPAQAAEPVRPPSPTQITPEQIAQAIDWLTSCLRANRERYVSFAHALTVPQIAALSPYFSPSLLGSVRIAELHGKRVETPDFFAQIRALGFDNLPDFAHMDSLTFLDVIVFNEKFSERALFHSLVHAAQIQILGVERYAELWVRGFLKTRAHFSVPLEVQAFSLASKFVRPTQPAFSVESEVLFWQAESRY